jgi:hypothetical protein
LELRHQRNSDAFFEEIDPKMKNDKVNSKMMERMNSEIDFVMNSRNSKQKIVKPYDN